mmetsp:Transcript_129940/g.363692  ORF Transcript_129940/g.363692 Transcript_129940/m.363692 type:complete len:608 (-) Transcript_129940:95-1918(-)
MWPPPPNAGYGCGYGYNYGPGYGYGYGYGYGMPPPVYPPPGSMPSFPPLAPAYGYGLPPPAAYGYGPLPPSSASERAESSDRGHRAIKDKEKEKKEEPEPVSLTVLIPGDSIARVIGKAGAGLKLIRESSGGVRIVVQEAGDDRSAPRRVELTGQPENIGAAAGLVLQQAAAGQGLLSLEVAILIPNKFTGQIIGKGGERLKLVRESTGVRIQVDREPVETKDDSEPERMLTVTGAPSAIGNGLALALGASRAAMTGDIATPTHSEVHAMPDDPEAIQVHFVVPGRLASAVVGRQGGNIRDFTEQSGCNRIALSSRTNSADRRFICIGNLDQVQQAEELIHRAAMGGADAAGMDRDALDQVTAIFWIPVELSGAVIGRSGATLGAIREQSGVKVQFGKEEVKSMRPCMIIGPLAAVLHAQTLIYGILVKEQQVKGPIKRPAVDDAGGEVKRFRTDGLPQETTKLLIPSKSAGAVIGRQGCGLGRIREDCGVKIEMLTNAQAPQWGDDRVVVLQGSREGRQLAVASVLQQAFPHEDGLPAVLKMLVTRAEAGAIIGKGGGTLKHLREQSGVSVQVEKNDIMGERLVSSRGALTNLVMVAQMILEVMST